MRDIALGSTVRLFFNSTNPDGGGAPVAPSSAFVAADIRIYKDGSATYKASTAGITVTSPFGSVVGLHLAEIDTSNNTDVGFWASGSVYRVCLVTAKTVATYTVSGLPVGEFSIEFQTARLAAVTHTGAVVPTVTTLSNLPAITANWLTAAGLATDAVAEIQSGLATASALSTTHALLQLTDTDVASIEARLPSDPADQSLVEAAITAATSPLATSSALSTVAGNITTLLGKFTGITLLARWLGILGGKTADSTTLAEINATTGGAGYNNVTDSLEAIRDRGDAAWVAGGGDATLENQTTMIGLLNEMSSQTDLIAGPGEDFVTILIEDNNVPVPDVSVWVTSDSAGATVVAGTLITGGAGTVRFLLTAGVTYYLWANKAGKVSIQGQSFVAVAD